MTQHARPATSSATFDVTVEGAEQLSPPAAAALRRGLQSYADDVFEEASRYEVLQRAEGSTSPEFTSKHVLDANDAVRRRFTLPTAKSSSNWRVAGNLAVYGCAAGVGVGGNQLAETWGLATFVACLVAGLFTIAILEATRGGAS